MLITWVTQLLVTINGQIQNIGGEIIGDVINHETCDWWGIYMALLNRKTVA